MFKPIKTDTIIHQAGQRLALCRLKGKYQLRWPVAVLGLMLVMACSSLDQNNSSRLFTDKEGAGGGIGGTGIVGVISDFGSIVVNGYRVATSPNTLIEIDGKAAAIEDLRVGHLVEVSASCTGENLSSQLINVRHEVLGPITAIDWPNGRISVLDQAVVFADDTSADLTLELGEFVAVSGYRLIDRTIVATRLDRSARTAMVHLYGQYRIDGEEIAVDGVVIDGLAPSPMLVGQEVFVRGDWMNGKLRPSQLENLPNVLFDGLTSEVSVSGFYDDLTNTVSKQTISNVGSELNAIKLSDGRSVPFGIFEGRWSSDRSAIEVQDQFTTDDVIDSPVNNQPTSDQEDLRDEVTGQSGNAGTFDGGDVSSISGRASSRAGGDANLSPAQASMDGQATPAGALSEATAAIADGCQLMQAAKGGLFRDNPVKMTLRREFATD